MIHVVLIATGKFIIDSIPGMTRNISWTAVNLSYLAVRPHHFKTSPNPHGPDLLCSAPISCFIG
jgi:hypothetical protein